MKTYKHLYPTIVSFENLYMAYKGAARGKRGQPNVAAFDLNLEDNLFQLQRELQARTYCPAPYYSFYIHDPKHRLVSAALFRDRVVHHALVRVIEPIFERSFIADSYANRAGKGTHRALDRAQFFARRCRYVLQCDVRQFFPSVDHTVLRGILARKLADRDAMWLVDRIVDSGVGVLSEAYDMVWLVDPIVHGRGAVPEIFESQPGPAPVAPAAGGAAAGQISSGWARPARRGGVRAPRPPRPVVGHRPTRGAGEVPHRV